MGREHGIPLMQSIAQLSYNSARPLSKMGLKAMQERGRMQKGMVADITIFDPKTVTDKATYVKGTLPSEGIPYVVVNGTVVVENSEGAQRRQSRSADPLRTYGKPNGAAKSRDLEEHILRSSA